MLIFDLEKVLESLKKRAFEHKNTICVGRSHGIHAEPTTFGLKLARFYAEFLRNHERLKNARNEIAVCAISGAVGTHANVSPKVQEYVAKKLNLSITELPVKWIHKSNSKLNIFIDPVKMFIGILLLKYKWKAF